MLCRACACAEGTEARLVLGEATRASPRGLDRIGPDWPSLHMVLQCHIPLWDFERAQARAARTPGAPGTRVPWPR